jgi:carboxyl-terminal processing protease
MVRRVLTFAGSFLFALALVGAAYAAGYYSRDRVRASEPGRYALLQQAQEYLDQYYLREQPTTTQREYGAIRGLLSTIGDKYTFLIEPPVAASESNVLAGTYGGIGVQINRDAQGRFVLFPFRDSPAYKAGLRDNDLLISVNDKEVPTTTGQDTVDQLLRGEVRDGNGVKVMVERGTEKLAFTIPFAVIDVPSVTWRPVSEVPDVGYIQVMRFTNRTPAEVEQAVKELSAANVKYLILDLRNNPGGLLDECVKVAGQFVGGGTIFVEKTKGKESEFKSPLEKPITDLPLVVLVNGGTASASELVAGAIRDRGRGILIGQKTYGKGSVQLILQLADKSSLHVTTAEWFPPSRKPLDGKGLVPDVAMIPDATGRDVELIEAIRQVKAQR